VETTLPPPVPVPATVSVPAGALNVAVTARALSTVSWHVPLPAQSPPHAPKLLPPVPAAVSTRLVPFGNDAVQVPLVVPAVSVHARPAGADVIVPLPVPDPVMVTAYGTGAKAATTLLLTSSVT
jgi:hypothetical protein